MEAANKLSRQLERLYNLSGITENLERTEEAMLVIGVE